MIKFGTFHKQNIVRLLKKLGCIRLIFEKNYQMSVFENNVWKVTLRNNDAVKHQGTQRRLCRMTIPCNLYLMIKRLITHVFDLDFLNF